MGDLWGGLAAMLVALPSSIAFGVLVYTAIGPENAGEGALAGMLGAAALGLTAPLIGRTGGLISAPCAPAAAVLSALAAELLSGQLHAGIDPAAIPALLALTVLLSAGFQVLYGAIGGGRLIKFIPFPVVSGYLSGVGVLIALGQLPKLFGLPKGTALFQGLLSPGLWKWQGLVVGLVTMAVMAFASRATRKIPGAILGLLAGIITYFGIGMVSPGLFHLEGNPLLIGPIQISGGFLEAVSGRAASLLHINLTSIRLLLVPALTLSVLLSIDTLKTCVVLDALTRSRHKSDRELIGQGISNLAAFFVGGMPGAGTMGPTLINVTSGGRTPRSGLIEGVFVVLALLLLGRLIAWVPIGGLAGVLLIVAYRMFDKSMFRLLRHRSGRMDFAVIVAVILVAVFVDLIAASGAGVFLAILLFIRDQVHVTVIRRKRYLNEVSSKTRRLAIQRDVLREQGDQAVFCELQGNLFFGTTDQLYSQLEPDLRAKRFILFDMRRVQSMDYTAAHLFEQMETVLAERGGQLLFCGMPSALLDQRDFADYLAKLGILRKEGGGVRIFETLDSALEYMEEKILEAADANHKDKEELLDVRDIEMFRGYDENAIQELIGCMKEVSVAQGEKVFSQGSSGDELFFVRRGSVRLLLPLPGGMRHHVATVGRGDFFGDLAFLDRGIRSADAEAKVPTDLYVLSRSSFENSKVAETGVRAQIYAALALAIAERLRQTNIELRALEER